MTKRQALYGDNNPSGQQFIMNLRYKTEICHSIPLIFIFSLLIAGCGGGRGVSSSSTSLAKIQTSQEVNELNTKILLQGSGSPASPADYLIGPADLLEVKVFESDRLTATSRVSSRGDITLPLLGSVAVDGLTAREAEQKVEDLLRRGRYINDPHVSVFLKENRSKLVSVVGYVAAPGTYDLLGKQTILDILAAAKGLRDNAGSSVYITRANGADGQREAFVVDLDQLLVKGNTDINLALKAGDVIYIPEAGTIFVEGAVKRPGSYPIKGTTTVSQSIAIAGGKAGFAGNGVELVRYLGNGRREVVQLDLGSIQNGETEDPILKDRDAIVLSASTAKRVLYGLRLNFLLGLIGVGYSPPETLQTQ
ncbi:MAG: polysaccharide biosynthesis/export family protein [Deltaproteobacteria bacterium]